MRRVLIIDDEKSIRSTLREILEYEKYKVEEAKDGAEGLQMLQQQSFDLALCDIKMPGLDGIEVLEKARESGVETVFIMVSAHGTIETAVEATRKGAYDFIVKPPDLNRLLISMRNALENFSLATEARSLRQKVQPNDSITGHSTSIVQLKEIIAKVAPTDAKVLILGPNGAGKELVAKQLHKRSHRSSGPFIEVNCAAIPGELIESELFGHEKGSFTSAIKQRIGKFEQAEEGTLFLDEIGDMSLAAQAKVLRAIQEKRISRVGGDKDISVDVRLVAATNKDLKDEIASGRFREDLYHRLAVIVINVPGLDERKEDIPLLADQFLSELSVEYGGKPKNIEKAAKNRLQKYSWPGNVRELRNIMERLYIMTNENITEGDVLQYAGK